MVSVNKVIIVGNLGRDPDLRLFSAALPAAAPGPLESKSAPCRADAFEDGESNDSGASMSVFDAFSGTAGILMGSTRGCCNGKPRQRWGPKSFGPRASSLRCMRGIGDTRRRGFMAESIRPMVTCWPGDNPPRSGLFEALGVTSDLLSR